jgi:hypothetical protein
MSEKYNVDIAHRTQLQNPKKRKLEIGVDWSPNIGEGPDKNA